MSGGLPFCTMVLDCWSMSSQLTTWTSRVVPVFFLYAAANWSQNALVLLAEYSAATSLIDFPAPPLLFESLLEAPVPPPQAARATAADPAPTRTTRRFSRTILSPLAMDETRPGKYACKVYNQIAGTVKGVRRCLSGDPALRRSCSESLELRRPCGGPGAGARRGWSPSRRRTRSSPRA